MGLGDGLADDRARRALAERLVDEAMAIGRLALHRDEQVAARHFAAVERHARNGEGRRSDAPRGLSNLFGGPEVSHRSEEHTSELQSLMRISYAVFCL